MPNDKTHRGIASQFFVAAELCRRGLVAVVTMGNCPNTDVLCSNKEASRFVHVQVKTFRPGDSHCCVGKKAEKDYGENFFWVLCGIPEPSQDVPFQYLVIPSKEMAMNVNEQWKLFTETLGRNGRSRSKVSSFRKIALPPRIDTNKWDLSPFVSNWRLIEKQLEDD